MRKRAPGGEPPRSAIPDWVVALMLIEATSMLIGFAMPLTPSRTGSTWSPAEWLVADPPYLLEVVVYYALANVLILSLGACAWVFYRLRDRGTR